jgi:IS5 family transposase
MKQAGLALNLSAKKTRKREFLEQMEHVVPWAALVELIAPFYPEGRTGRPPFSLPTMLRIHFMQQWFSLSDPAMEEAFFDTPLYREFAKLEEFGRLPLKPPFCGSVIGWKNTNWLSKYCSPSMNS